MFRVGIAMFSNAQQMQNTSLKLLTKLISSPRSSNPVAHAGILQLRLVQETTVLKKHASPKSSP